MPDSECRLLRSGAELEAFAPAWRALWREDPHATPFQSPEWLLPWWREFQEGNLRAAVISGQGRPIAFLPFYLHHAQRSLLLLGAGTSDYLDGVFSPACSAQHVRAALDAVMAESGWDALYATQLREESLLLRAVRDGGDLASETYAGESCSFVPAACREQLPAKIRRNVAYYRTRAMQCGNLELTRAGDSDYLEAFDALVRLHTERWQAQAEPGVLSDPRILAWHRGAIPMLRASGLLRLYSLQLNGETIAAAYCLIDPPGRAERRLYIYITAHSVRCREFSPGTLLVGLIIERAVEEGARIVDFLRGDESYKHVWHPQPIATYGISAQSARQRVSLSWT